MAESRAPFPITYPDLPITERRQELLDVIEANQVVVVAGETGSGKSTQLPKFCLELGRGQNGRRIGHTQPRRIAARAIAERLASELKTELGEAVGYAVRFTDEVGPNTLVKVMTDGILLNEIQRDRDLMAYDTIIVDEAHERSLNIDFLLGHLRRVIERRNDLKVIITSATIDTARFSAHFDDAPIVEVSGRTYPVEIRYRPLDTDAWGDKGPAQHQPAQHQPVLDQPVAVCEAVGELFKEGPGDILAFFAGERDIRDAEEALLELELPNTEIVPLYARLTAAEQHRVFAKHKKRRIVLSTNVAETSLTVPGIHYVIDTGMARISRFNRRTKVQRLPIEPISQASASQRSGRCGRLGPGIAIRLYDEEDFDNRDEFTEPEIQRTNLAAVILRMKAARLGEIDDFPFVDPPDTRAIADGLALLHELGATDGEAKLTKLGRRLDRLPVDPRIGRIVLAGVEQHCVQEVLIIAAGMSIRDPRERPRGQEQQATELHKRFRVEGSDLLSWLKLWDYINDQRSAGSSSRFRRQCRREYLNYPRIREWQEVHSQLRRACRAIGVSFSGRAASVFDNTNADRVHQAILTGLLAQIGQFDRETKEFRGTRGTRFAVSPASVLFKTGPEWVVAAD
ncbi:ATP-dependent RNA helicase HrpA, partial [Acidimicrobiaceae bacterium AH-315-P05]|nr:ATP-dependent RNA helicase HrpA [Acidimicrobiaceae bacterium AH-315-P05]